MRFYLRIGFVFFYKKFSVQGLENIPKKKAVMYLPNHQNTFMDALVVAVSQSKVTHYMARADIFTNKTMIWLMSTVNLRPIYRLRDGKKAVIKNEQVFEELQDFMSKGESVMLHPEGTHSLKYRLRPLTKGFTRLAFGFLERFPHMELEIIPVGINYSAHSRYRSKVSVIYGKPIDVRPFFEKEEQNQAALELRDLVYERIKPLITHIKDEEGYDEIFAELRHAGADFSDPDQTRALLKEIEAGQETEPQEIRQPNVIEKQLYQLVYLNNWFIMLLWKKLKPTFKDRAWHGPIKFCLGIFVLPLVYLLQASLVWALSSWRWAVTYLIISILSVSVLRIKQD